MIVWLLVACIATVLFGLRLLRSMHAPHKESEDHTLSLIKANQEIWDGLVNHPFPRQMAQGTAPLNGFRHYMIQDAAYLEFYSRVRMQSIANSRSRASFGDLESFVTKLSNGFQRAKDMRSICETQLGVPRDVVTNEPISDQVKRCFEHYEYVAREGDWLDMHIVLLPRVMGYSTIANELLRDPATIRNTLYYRLWIQTNASKVSLEQYKGFINESIDNLPADDNRWDYWIKLFNAACDAEKAFFDLAYEQPKYEIVEDGRYKIRSYGKDGVYLVSGEGGQVFAQLNDPSDLGVWELTNARDGYSIKNVASGSLLGVSVTDRFPPYYEVNNKGEGHNSWSVNPVPISGKNAYQLFVSAMLQFTLDVNVGEKISKVFVANGYTGSSQTWVLDSVP